MLRSTLGDYPLLIIEPGEEYEAEPFSIIMTLKIEEESTKVTSVCNDIPCSYCAINEECKNGENRTKVLTAKIKDISPELFI